MTVRPGRSGWISCAVAVLSRPSLWATAVLALVRFVPGGGSVAFGGVGSYSRWRMQTAYGDPAAKPIPRDLVEYMEWLRELRVIMRSGTR